MSRGLDQILHANKKEVEDPADDLEIKNIKRDFKQSQLTELKIQDRQLTQSEETRLQIKGSGMKEVN
ncbi:hypothetical protein EVAR_84510_1 [Eumeta japonica]|uniref:Uncharacterized protein n=1 Tax=Eumeta variegata TaxID=151549 RepID=A0A4C1UJ00_EUMVA|nr:hypothetical protein EVAR_84510_1 [Eumeta japonica]